MEAKRSEKIVDLVQRLLSQFNIKSDKGFIWIQPTEVPSGLDMKY